MTNITKTLKTWIAGLALCLGVSSQAQTFTQISAYDTIANTPDSLGWYFANPDSLAFGTAYLTVYYEGDFGASSEYITIFGENNYQIGVTQPYFDGSDCMADSVTLSFPASLLNSWMADDTLRFHGLTTSNVDLFCTANHARVKLVYNYCSAGPLAELSIPATSFCPLDAPVALNATPSGGTLTGSGITGNMFDPSQLVPGSYTLTYAYTNQSNCASIAEVTVTINEGPVVTASADTICPWNMSTLSSTGTGHLVWYSDLALTTPVDTGSTFTTPQLMSTTTYYVATTLMDPYFVMTSFSDADSAVVDHDAETGDDRGGIAVTQNYVYVVGDDSTARFDLNLQNVVSYPRADGLLSDLSNGQLYTPYNPMTGMPDANIIDSMYVTELRTLNADLTLGNGVLTLSDSIPFGWDSNYDFQSGVFAGSGFTILYSAPRKSWYVIDLADGVVTNLGTLADPQMYYSENWAAWGVAEFDGNYSVLYRDANSNNVVRRSLPAGTPTVAYAFSDISDMASFTYAPWNNRWYMHFEGGSQFNGMSETVVYATANDSTGAEVGGATINCPNAITVFVDVCTGIEEQAAGSVSLFPNPNTGRFTVRLSDMNDATIEIFSPEGRLVHSERLSGAQAQKELDLSGLAAGIYHVRVSSDANVATAKLIKQ